jgi:hypothetical protein
MSALAETEMVPQILNSPIEIPETPVETASEASPTKVKPSSRGEWTCPACGHFNTRKKAENCKKCKAPIPYTVTIPGANRNTSTKKTAAKEIVKALHTDTNVKKGKAKEKAPKAPAPAKAKAPTNGQKMSCLDAAAKVLSGAKEPMSCPEMIEKMASRGYWTSPGGATPAATLSAGIGTEIRKKGKDSRFRKVSPGHFLLK